MSFEQAFNAISQEPRFSRLLAEAVISDAHSGIPIYLLLHEDGTAKVRGRGQEAPHIKTTARRIALRVPLCPDVPQEILLAGMDEVIAESQALKAKKRKLPIDDGFPAPSLVTYFAAVGFVQTAHAKLSDEFQEELHTQARLAKPKPEKK